MSHICSTIKSDKYQLQFSSEAKLLYLHRVLQIT